MITRLWRKFAQWWPWIETAIQLGVLSFCGYMYFTHGTVLLGFGGLCLGLASLISNLNNIIHQTKESTMSTATVTDPADIEEVEKRDNPATVIVAFVLNGSRAVKRALMSDTAKTIYAATGAIVAGVITIAACVYVGYYISNVLFVINPTLAYVVVGGILGLSYLTIARSAYRKIKSWFFKTQPEVTTVPA